MSKVPPEKYQKLLDYIVSKLKTGNVEVSFTETNEISEQYSDEPFYYKLDRLTLIIDYHEGGKLHD